MAAKLKNPGLESIIASIEKQLGGKDIIIMGDDKSELAGGDTILSFGYPDVDEASNCGGVARGKIIEIFGPESGGKSFLSLKLIASTQKLGLACCLVDVEQSYDKKWAAKQGVDTSRLCRINKSMCAEEMLDYVASICNSGGFGLVVVDSVAALIPKKELEGSVVDQDYALLARAMSKALRKIVAGCGATKTTCVFINQIRDKMGVSYGNPTTTPGGKALKFYSHQRIMVVPGEVIKIQDGAKEKVVARKSKVKFVKNKTAAPMGECVIEIVFDEASMNPLVALCNAAKDTKLIYMRDGALNIKKEVVGEKKNVETGSLTIVQLADYIAKNQLIQKLVDAYVAAMNEEGEKVPKAIQVILDAYADKPETLFSPLEGKSVSVEKAQTDEKLMAELQEDAKKEDSSPEE